MMNCKECREGETKEKGIVIPHNGGYHFGCLKCKGCGEGETKEKGLVFISHGKYHLGCPRLPPPCSCCS